MLNIALCSGSSRELDLLESMLEDYRSLRPQPEFACRRFLSLADLQERARAGERFPLCFVDLHIPWGGKASPAETVRQLEPDTLIVSLSTVLELGRLDHSRPFACLAVPVSSGALFPVLDQALARIQELFARTLEVRVPGGPRYLPFHQIALACYHDHRLLFHMADGEKIWSNSLRAPFKELCAPLLQDSAFVQVAAACIANLHYVDSIQGRRLLMRDGVSAAIPRKNFAQVCQALRAFQNGAAPE